MPEIIVVGDIDTDIFYVVPHLPTWDEGVLVDEVHQRPGGKGGNTAAALSRLGMETGIIAAAGDDVYGEIALEGLERCSVDATGVTVVSGGCTYYCIMMLDPTGEKAILVVHTPLTYPTGEMIRAQKNFLLSGKHAHFIALDAERMAVGMKIAQEGGMTVSVDLDACYQGWDSFNAVRQYADLVFMNRQAAVRLFGEREPREVVQDLIARGPSRVVLTLGQKGVVAADGKQVYEAPSFLVPVRDTTGAGDVFSGAFLRVFLRGGTMDRALRFASAAAAMSTRGIGGQSAIPVESEVWNFVNQKSEQGE